MRVTLFVLTIVCGVAAIVIGLLMPAHLRAVDPQVLLQHGRTGKSLVAAAAETAPNNPAVAKLFLAAAEELQLLGTDVVVENLRAAAADRTRSRTLLEQLEAQESGRIQVAEIPVTTALRKSTNRERLRASLQSVEAKQILRTRELTNMILFASVRSAAGFPLDVASLTTAFLLEQRAFAPTLPMRDEVLRVGASGGTQELEELYLSIFALAKRFSSEQIIELIANMPDADALHAITRQMQERPESTPLLYSAAVLSKQPGAVARYLTRLPKSAERDIAFALGGGINALSELLSRQQPIYRSGFYNTVAESRVLGFILRPLVRFSTNTPVLALAVKFMLVCGGAFLLACSLRFRKPRTVDPGYQTYPEFTLVRRAAFSTIFLLVMIIVGEPYLAQGEPAAPKVTWSFPLVLGAATPVVPQKIEPSTSMLDPHTILAIVTFLVLQAIIYVICLVKLAEIKKQPVSTVTKLKLLDNEDNLFDGGLYAGLFGTAASLVLLTLGVIKPSLVSAYSSTLFGILFVALLKIGHVRPLKRRLLLETSDRPTA